MTDLLARYPVVLEIAVAWGDMDAFRHVNNTVYFRYFESARVAYLERIDVGEFMAGESIGPILARIECRFRLPITYPDSVAVGTRVRSLGADRFIVDHCLVSRQYGTVAAQGDGTVVTYDYRAGRKAPIPAAVRARILDLEAACGNEVELVT